MSKEVKRYNFDVDKFGSPRAYESEHGRWMKRADYDALLAERDAAQKDAERWRPLSAPGQIKAGDWLSFTVGGEFKCARVKEVLRPGSDREEVIWNRRKNFYFVTRMALDGSSTHKRVMIAAMQGEQL